MQRKSLAERQAVVRAVWERIEQTKPDSKLALLMQAVAEETGEDELDLVALRAGKDPSKVSHRRRPGSRRNIYTIADADISRILGGLRGRSEAIRGHGTVAIGEKPDAFEEIELLWADLYRQWRNRRPE